MKTGKRFLSLIFSILFVFGTAVAAFAVDDSGKTTVRATNCGSEVTLEYKQSKTYEFEAENMPEGASIHVFCNGEDRGAGTYINVNDPTEDYTVEAKVLDADGSVIAASGEIRVTVKNGFFDRFKASLKNVFGTIGDAIMDVLSAIFMRIWIFLHR